MKIITAILLLAGIVFGVNGQTKPAEKSKGVNPSIENVKNVPAEKNQQLNFMD